MANRLANWKFHWVAHIFFLLFPYKRMIPYVREPDCNTIGTERKLWNRKLSAVYMYMFRWLLYLHEQQSEHNKAANQESFHIRISE